MIHTPINMVGESILMIYCRKDYTNKLTSLSRYSIQSFEDMHALTVNLVEND